MLPQPLTTRGARNASASNKFELAVMRPLGHAICHAQRDATHHALHLADTRRLHQRLLCSQHLFWQSAHEHTPVLFTSHRLLTHPTVQVHCKREE